MEYGSEVARRFGAVERIGDLPADTPGLLTGEAADRTLQVWVRFQLQVNDGIVQKARFRVFGCPHTVAAASYVAEWLEGRPLESARQLDVQALRAALDVPVEKLGKLLRIEDALAACRRGRSDGETRGN
jgi:NifU-like protein involved in Fe-S cluster formation